MLSNLKIPPYLRRKVETELQPGESIKWIEQPVPRFVTGASIVAVLFGIPWTSFALFWTWGALGFRLPSLSDGFRPEYLFALFGVPFILLGLGMLSSPWAVWEAARRTVYIVTDRRAIAIEGGWSVTTIRSYSPHELGYIFRRECADGTGDVIIIKRQWTDSDGDSMTEEIGFKGVRNPREMERILKMLAQTAR